jgi:hypothetical protein
MFSSSPALVLYRLQAGIKTKVDKGLSMAYLLILNSASKTKRGGARA